MTDTTKLIDTLKRNLWVVQAQTAGLTHADSLRQLPFRGNCLNWVTGHLVVHRDKMGAALGLQPALEPAATALYARGSEPVTGDSEAVPLERLLALLAQQQETLVTSLSQATPAALAALADPARELTAGDRVEFLIWHEAYHLGQLEILRQLAGKDDSII